MKTSKNKERINVCWFENLKIKGLCLLFSTEKARERQGKCLEVCDRHHGQRGIKEGHLGGRILHSGPLKKISNIKKLSGFIVSLASFHCLSVISTQLARFQHFVKLASYSTWFMQADAKARRKIKTFPHCFGFVMLNSQSVFISTKILDLSHSVIQWVFQNCHI